MQRQPVLDRVDALLDRHTCALQALGVGGDAKAHAGVGLVHDHEQGCSCMVRGYGSSRPPERRAGCRRLRRPGAGADLLPRTGLAQVIGPSRLPVHG